MELKDLQGQDINTFISNYRKALGHQYNAGNAALQQQRTNDFANIMAGANKSGMLYSNFPQRTKIQYDTQTLYPAMTKSAQTHQTALDKVRANAVNLFNQSKTIEEAIADLNKA